MRPVVFILAAFVAWVVGCATSGGRAGGQPQEIHLYGVPATLNLDGAPGPDGFSVRIYASRSDRAKGLVVNSGAIEVLMFDGVTREFNETNILKSWRFTPKELPEHEMETSLGHGYQFVLRWEDKKPAHENITVLARYLPKSGAPVYSAPSSISARLK
jgi:hypothetical protein